MLAIDGSREVPAVLHPAQDVAMGWSPDGAYVMFSSDRSGRLGLWAVPFSPGRPQGKPELIKSDLGSTNGMGITAGGALYFGAVTGDRDVHVATVDFQTGRITEGPSTPIQNYVGGNGQPRWSPDGRQLAYISRRDPADRRRPLLVIRSMDTQQERVLRPELSYINRLGWMPEGASLIANGPDLKGRRGVYRIDANTGQVSPLVASDPGEAASAPAASPDGRKFFYIRNEAKSNSYLEREIRSGKERELLRRQDSFWPVLSPDGRRFALLTSDSFKSPSVLSVVSVETGEMREVWRLKEPEVFFRPATAWTPDGRSLIVKKNLSAGTISMGSEVWIVPLDGRAPYPLSTSLQQVMTISVHPDGRQIALTAGEHKVEVWAIENFLPALSARQ